MAVLLENKVAVIYGAGGPIGGAVARAFAREGAGVFLAGRTRAKLDALAGEIRADGGQAESAEVNALDAAAVDEFVDGVVEQAGRVDVSFNVISLGDVQRPLTDLSVDEFLQPVTTALRSHFLTAKAAVRHMIGRDGG
jgi:NAD(P)-dependent dehydrogenase (short-subunit alcohol dehydrogenase family)